MIRVRMMEREMGGITKIILVILLGVTQANAIERRVLLTAEENEHLQLIEMPRLGIAISLGDGEIMLADDPELKTYSFPFLNDVRQFIVSEDAAYCSIGNWVCRLDPETEKLEEVAVFDNDGFKIYPTVGQSFFVSTSEPEWSTVMLVDPLNKVYTPVVKIEAYVHKVLSNRYLTLVWVDDSVYILGDDNKMYNFVSNKSIKDVVLFSAGIVCATDDGLLLVQSKEKVFRLFKESYKKLWNIAGNLYMLSDDGELSCYYGFADYLKSQSKK
ncbi:MAG: hypothetical protein IKL35_08600 [Muribaculaceae bacterium]|nr:hypothetical protein [Muribaculaceae bacterium]